MKISIITATFNSYPNIISVFKNLKSQTFSGIEHTLIDGGSTDGTKEEIEKCKDVSSFISERDKGIYDALNKGVKKATGDVIGFLHSDDLLASNDILSQIANVFESENIDGVYGDLEYVDKNDTTKIIRNWKSRFFKSQLLKKGWMPAHPTLFLKREVYEKHGNFNIKYKIAADYDFMLRVLKDDTLKLYYLPRVITKMRVGGASNGKLKSIIQKSREDLEIMRKHEIGGIYTLLGKNLSKIKQFY